MKTTRIWLSSFAAAALLFLPAASAFGSQPPPPNQTPNYQHRQDQNRQQANRGNRDERSTRGHERLPAYSFGSRGQQRLRDRYNQTNYRRDVNSRNRARLYRGGYLPNGWRGRIHPLPPQYVRELPAPPQGYLIGYFDGYAVVYNPNTGLILQVVNVY